MSGAPRYRARAPLALLALAVVGLVPAAAFGQGASGAAVQGTVTAAGVGVPGALVTLTDLRSGSARRVSAGENGNYLFENVSVGAYRLSARAIGMAPFTVNEFFLHLGERVRIPIVLGNAIGELEKVVVGASVVRDAGSGGPGQFISRESIRNLPLLKRDFVGLFAASPQAAGPGGLWISGQHSRYNAIQIDGTSANDLFGVAVTPGSAAGARAISLEALEEIRVLIAPFDVRSSGFSGGLINAVTRAGSNDLHASIVTSYSRAELVGSDTSGAGVPGFNQLQYALSVSGPIVRDRLHYIVVADVQAQTSNFVGPSVTDISTGVSEQTASRAALVFRDRFGFDAGDSRSPHLQQPNQNLFFKLSWHPSVHHSIELSESVARGTFDQLNRTNRNSPNVDGWQLSKSGVAIRTAVETLRFKAVSSLGRFSNEAIVSHSMIDDRRDSRNRVPLFIVRADRADTYLAGGSTKSSQDTRTAQRIIELADNVSWHNDRHVVTVGTQNLLLRVRDNFFTGSWGVFGFNSIDDFEKGIPSLYEVALPGPQGGPIADYSSLLVSGYAQDRWALSDRLTVTAGVRADAPFFDSPRTNALLASKQILGGVDTGHFPSGNTVVAPRVGFARQLGQNRNSLLRGGAGVFAGRPPFAWITSAFLNTGQEQTILTCRRADGVPAPTTDIRKLPSRCLNTTALPPVASVNYFPSNFRFQQAVKYAVGLDHDFGNALTGSVDIIHTRSRDNLFVNDVNLVDRGSNSEGRQMYGSIGSDGVSRQTRLDSTSFGGVYRYGNISADRSTSISASMERRWRSGANLHLAYGWSRTLDVMSMTGFTSSVIYRNNPVDGTLAHRSLRRSGRDIPHSLVATGSAPLPFGATGSLFLRARSGTPFAYAANGDANADGTRGNDLSYIPLGVDDISLSNPSVYHALNAFIESQSCLRAQRGRIMTRTSCRNPSVVSVDTRLVKKLFSLRGRSLEIGADVFNVANLLNRSWGLARETTSTETAPLLSITGWDAVQGRPRYAIPVTSNGEAVLPPVNKVVLDASRWRMQVGARYDF